MKNLFLISGKLYDSQLDLADIKAVVADGEELEFFWQVKRALLDGKDVKIEVADLSKAVNLSAGLNFTSLSVRYGHVYQRANTFVKEIKRLLESMSNFKYINDDLIEDRVYESVDHAKLYAPERELQIASILKERFFPAYAEELSVLVKEIALHDRLVRINTLESSPEYFTLRDGQVVAIDAAGYDLLIKLGISAFKTPDAAPCVRFRAISDRPVIKHVTADGIIFRSNIFMPLGECPTLGDILYLAYYSHFKKANMLKLTPGLTYKHL